MPITGNYIDIPFGTAGTITTVPDGIQVDGSISFTQGWGPNYLLPQSNPSALNVDNGTMNYLFNLLTTTTQQWQQFTTAPWITHAENGGSAFPYAKYATVLYTDGHVYESLVANNTTDPTNDGVHWKIVDASATSARTLLTTNTSYYVSTTGSDSNPGTSGSPWLTIQHALNVILQTIDLGGYLATVNVATGTYTGTIILNGPFTGGGQVLLLGNNTTPDDCFLDVSSGNVVTLNGGANLTMEGFKLTAASGRLFDISNSFLVLTNGNFDFGSASVDHVFADDGSLVYMPTTYEITGASPHHMSSANNSSIRCQDQTVTLSGTLNFSGAFANAQQTGTIIAGGSTYTGGTITGVTANVISNAVIDTGGGGNSYFPGNSNPTNATGGQYI